MVQEINKETIDNKILHLQVAHVVPLAAAQISVAHPHSSSLQASRGGSRNVKSEAMEHLKRLTPFKQHS